MNRFELHVKNWGECTRCDLHSGRQYVVMVRGSIPCKILFVGEAPGESENTLGQPFVGPAGHLLNDIINSAIPPTITYALTNLVGCIPRSDEGGKLKEPPDDAIKACGQRLIELVSICNPKLIVCVGKLADDWLDIRRKYRIKIPDTIPRITITHPSAILQGPFPQRPLTIKKQIITIQSAIEDMNASNQ